MAEKLPGSAASLDVPYCWAVFCAGGLEVQHEGDYRIAKHHADKWDEICDCGGPHRVERRRCHCLRSMTARQHREALDAE